MADQKQTTEAPDTILAEPLPIELNTPSDDGIMAKMIASGQQVEQFDRTALDAALKTAEIDRYGEHGGLTPEVKKEMAKLEGTPDQQPVISDDRNNLPPAKPTPEAEKLPTVEPKPDAEVLKKEEDYKFPEVDLPELYKKPDAEPKFTEDDTKGIIKKYYGDEALDENQRKLVEPLAKAHLHLQQRDSETREELATLTNLVKEIQTSGGDKTSQPSSVTPETTQPSAKPELPAEAQDLTEEMVEKIYEEDGLLGVLKLAESRAESRNQQATSQQRAVAEKTAIETRNKHNADMLVDRARQYLANSAAANNNRAEHEKYSDPNYKPDEAEVSRVWSNFVAPEVEFLSEHRLVDADGNIKPEHFEIAYTYLNRKAISTAADRRGYERGLKDRDNVKKGPTTIEMRSQPVPGEKPKLSEITDPLEIKRAIAEMSPEEQTAHLAKLRQNNYTM